MKEINAVPQTTVFTVIFLTVITNHDLCEINKIVDYGIITFMHSYRLNNCKDISQEILYLCHNLYDRCL